MFRAFAFAAILLTACGIQTTSEPRIIKMPEPTLRQNVKSPDWIKIYKEGEPAEPQTFNIFNQKNQYLTLNFYPLSKKMHKGLRVELVDGHKLLAQYKEGEKELLSIHKIGPSTPREFLISIIGKDVINNKRCELKEVEPNIWYLNVLDIASYSEAVEKDKICGPHAEDWHGSPTTFFIKDGIGIVASKYVETFGLDMSSIIYENRG